MQLRLFQQQRNNTLPHPAAQQTHLRFFLQGFCLPPVALLLWRESREIPAAAAIVGEPWNDGTRRCPL